MYENGYVEYYNEHEFSWFEYGTWGKDYDEVKALGLEMWNGEAK